MVAECRKALTGVGAAIAPGSQKCHGTCADLVNAPTQHQRQAHLRRGRGRARPSSTPCRSAVPASCTRHTRPPSIASPPAPVTSSARCAATRAPATWSSRPISRNDSTEVSSQKTNSVQTSSATTRPSIAPANSVKYPAKRTTRRGESSSAKYPQAYAITAVPMPATTNAISSAKPSSRNDTDSSSPLTHVGTARGRRAVEHVGHLRGQRDERRRPAARAATAKIHRPSERPPDQHHDASQRRGPRRGSRSRWRPTLGALHRPPHTGPKDMTERDAGNRGGCPVHTPFIVTPAEANDGQ